uniref:G_PROTEIN_RECEP_F1_2 domain-containing protein n=1 Tax=Globodera pallida TaxID=36090 RepID=A0A183CF62_GLOPA
MNVDCVFRPTFDNYLMICAFCVIFCLSVVGNSIVVVVILQQRSMRSVTNLYLLNLALSDLLLSMPPTLVSSLVYCWVFGDLFCKLLAYLQPVVVTASAYTLAAIALERYYAICKPLHSRVWHTRAHAMFVISLVWLVSVIANVFMLFMYEERSYNRNGLNCAPKFEPIVHFGYQIYMTFVLLVIPLVTMTVLYGNVIATLRGGIRIDIASVEIETNINNNSIAYENGTNAARNSSDKTTTVANCSKTKVLTWHQFLRKIGELRQNKLNSFRQNCNGQTTFNQNVDCDCGDFLLLLDTFIHLVAAAERTGRIWEF